MQTALEHYHQNELTDQAKHSLLSVDQAEFV